MREPKGVLQSVQARSPLALITLELAASFYEDMGLFPVAPPVVFREVIRRACGSPEALNDWGEIATVWENCLELVTTAIGDTAGDNLKLWAEDIAFETWTWSESWWDYQRFMGSSKALFYSTGVNPLDSLGCGKSLLRLYAVMCSGNDCDRLFQSLASRKLSEWDSRVLDLMAWKTEDRDSGDPDRHSIQDTISCLVSKNTFQIFWHVAMSLFPSCDMHRLTDLVARHRAENGLTPPKPAFELRRRLPI